MRPALSIATKGPSFVLSYKQSGPVNKVGGRWYQSPHLPGYGIASCGWRSDPPEFIRGFLPLEQRQKPIYLWYLNT
jgi:hypothetical protein